MITREQVTKAAEALGLDPEKISQLRITEKGVWAEVWDGTYPITAEWHYQEIQP